MIRRARERLAALLERVRGWIGPPLRRARELAAPLVRPVRAFARAVWAGLLAPVRWIRGLARREPEPAPRPPPTRALLFAGAIGVILVAAVALIVVRSTSPPTPPYLPLDPAEEIARSVFDHDRGVLFVRDGDDDIHAFVAPDDRVLRWCGDSGRIEGSQGGVWDPQGHPLTGDTPLMRHPVRVFDGILYMNSEATLPPSGPAPASSPDGGDVAPACPAPDG